MLFALLVGLFTSIHCPSPRADRKRRNTEEEGLSSSKDLSRPISCTSYDSAPRLYLGSSGTVFVPTKVSTFPSWRARPVQFPLSCSLLVTTTSNLTAVENYSRGSGTMMSFRRPHGSSITWITHSRVVTNTLPDTQVVVGSTGRG